MSRMEIRRVDINDSEHPLKTGEMFLDKTNNILYVGGMLNTGDIDLRGVLNMIRVNLSIMRLPEELLTVIISVVTINASVNIDLSNIPVEEYGKIILTPECDNDITLKIERI